MRTEGMDQVRAAVKVFSSDGKTVVTAVQLSEFLNLETESQKNILRKRLHMLMNRGEVEKVAYGQFRYVPGKELRRNGESYMRVWRIIRVQNPGWTIQTIAALARVSRTVVERYGKWLEDEGFVERAGRNGNSILWRTTAKGREQRETPWPLVDLPDPYAPERTATAALCTLLLTADPDQASTRVKIRKHLATLTTRFCTQLENEPETQGVLDDC